MNKGADGNSVPVRLTVQLTLKMHRHLQQVELLHIKFHFIECTTYSDLR
jgi:hypothetical protein